MRSSVARAIEPRVDRETLVDKPELTAAEKLRLLRLTKRLLGPGGERWVKGYWFGQRDPDTTRAAGTLPAMANSWCLLGAMEEAAYRLGWSNGRGRERRWGYRTSVAGLVSRNSGGMSVDEFNDAWATKWRDVEAILDERIRELEEEKKR